MTTKSRIKVQRITSNTGAVIDGVDLRQSLDPETMAVLREALCEHGVIFLRDQDVSPQQYWTYLQLFGRPQKGETGNADRDRPEDLVEADFSAARYATNIWHADVTSLAQPPIATALRCVETPPVGGDTCWSSMYAAWEALTEPMQRMLDGLTAIHSIALTLERQPASSRFVASYGEGHKSQQVHPVVLTHPVTGRRALNVNEAFTTRIVELDRLESQAILSFLYRHVEKPDFIARWKWAANDVAVWDNRCVQHYAVPDYSSTRRMQRVVIMP